MTATKLSVNLNKIALIRTSREGNFHDLIAHGRTCLEAGADGMTVQPRTQQRHIRARDIPTMEHPLQECRDAEFNIEGNTFDNALGSYTGFMEFLAAQPPHQCNL